MATHRLLPQQGPRRALPVGLVRTSNVTALPIITIRRPIMNGFVMGFGDSIDATPAGFLATLPLEQQALLQRQRDADAAAAAAKLTNQQKTWLAEEAHRAENLANWQATRAAAINKYNAATTDAQRASAAKAIATAQTAINYNLDLLQQYSQKLAASGLAPSAASTISAYSNGAPVTTSNAAIPGDPPPPNVGTLPLGLPGQQPAVNNNTALINAMQGGNVAILVPSSTPANIIAAGNTNVGGGVVLAPTSASNPPTILTGGSSGLPTLRSSPTRIDTMPPATQLFTDSGIRQTSPGQAGPSGDQLAGNSVALAMPPALQGIPPLYLIGGAVLLILLLKH